MSEMKKIVLYLSKLLLESQLILNAVELLVGPPFVFIMLVKEILLRQFHVFKKDTLLNSRHVSKVKLKSTSAKISSKILRF